MKTPSSMPPKSIKKGGIGKKRVARNFIDLVLGLTSRAASGPGTSLVAVHPLDIDLRQTNNSTSITEPVRSQTAMKEMKNTVEPSDDETRESDLETSNRSSW
ncbi:unnamed protein product [Ilex paraguariensis]|uniref:Uncharacterized protein n=1 Tax=Ilex paraguariensis TaxID=185542 RepID=A0ABC8RYF4_9AQUA